MPQCLFSIASVANFSYTNIFYYTLIAVQMLIYLFLFSNLENFPSCIMHVVWYDYDSFCESIFLGKAFKKVHTCRKFYQICTWIKLYANIFPLMQGIKNDAFKNSLMKSNYNWFWINFFVPDQKMHMAKILIYKRTEFKISY